MDSVDQPVEKRRRIPRPAVVFGTGYAVVGVAIWEFAFALNSPSLALTYFAVVPLMFLLQLPICLGFSAVDHLLGIPVSGPENPVLAHMQVVVGAGGTAFLQGLLLYLGWRQLWDWRRARRASREHDPIAGHANG